jgi:hypothetical protein
MGAGIIIHQNEPITNCTSIQPYLGFKDLISLPLGSQCASVEDNEVITSIPADSTPDHYWSATIAIVFRNVCCMEPFP